MDDRAKSIDGQYGRPELGDSVLEALRASGEDPDALGRDDVASFDEFHIQGREATRELARMAGVGDGTETLDVGSGIGGPARTVAEEFGANVTGIDLTEEYVRFADRLTEMLGLGDQVRFERGDALEMPYGDDVFDVVWLQHTSMNVADKPELFAQIRRVLRPDGRLALHEICAGSGGPPHFPVPWADEPSLSFLVTPEELSEMLATAGFERAAWRDVTAESLTWFRETVEAMENRPPDAPPPLGLNLLMGDSTAEKAKNVIRNLEENRIAVVQGVFEAVE